MFVQVINGKVGDAAAARAMGDRWIAELGADAPGWLGSTAGVTADGEFVVLARFASAEEAQRNSERPEQGAWWGEMEKLFVEEPRFADYDDVILVRGGGSDQAGFVQVMVGQTADPVRERKLTQDFAAIGDDFRPDILGGVVGIQDDGTFAQAFYFTSEQEAREGEKLDPPAELRDAFDEELQLTSDIRFLDLTEPWLNTAR
ncbi:MAG TPA: hypothetical protein VIU87_01045 [Mycobacterium sp.]